MSETIKVIVNDEPRELPAGSTVADLIRHLGLSKAACAAEINRALIPRREHESRALSDRDIVEVVTLVGGG